LDAVRRDVRSAPAPTPTPQLGWRHRHVVPNPHTGTPAIRRTTQDHKAPQPQYQRRSLQSQTLSNDTSDHISDGDAHTTPRTAFTDVLHKRPRVTLEPLQPAQSSALLSATFARHRDPAAKPHPSPPTMYRPLAGHNYHGLRLHQQHHAHHQPIPTLTSITGGFNMSPAPARLSWTDWPL